MTLTPKENVLITDYLYLAEREAAKQYTHTNLTYDDLCSIGRLRIIEIIANSDYKQARSLKSFLARAAKYAMIDAIRREHKYLLTPEYTQLEDLANTAHAKNQLKDDGFDYVKARYFIGLLEVEEQEIIKYILDDQLIIAEICGRLHLARSTINKRIRKIKDKLRDMLSEVL